MGEHVSNDHDIGFAGLARLDWNDSEAVQKAAAPLLSDLATSGQLEDLIARVPSDPRLGAKCEHLRALDKLVLADDPQTGIRLRLHIFADRYLDLPHNHRWTYSSLMLQGSYMHFVYGPWDENSDAATDVRRMKPRLVQRIDQGVVYTMDHRMVHSLAADSATMTLILRGPSMKKRAIWTDRVTNELWWHEGGAEDARMQVMNQAEISELCARVRARLEERPS
jgi:hypothetical protein